MGMRSGMDISIRRGAVLLATMLIFTACSTGGGASPTASSTSPTTTESPSGSTAGSPSGSSSPSASMSEGASGSPSGSASASEAADPNDLLAKIKAAGVIRVSTDPKYPPQSELKPDGTFEGFDIDVANEIAKRLGVKTKFETPNFDLVVAGGWAGRWDISVGSVTVTQKRQEALDFTEPYYFTPAQLAATKASSITTLEGFAGKTICVGESTTYLDWLKGDIKLAGDVPEPAPPPAGVKATTFPTDTDCAESVASGRQDFEGFLTSSTTLESVIKNGAPFVKVGDPVFYEALAVATDKKGPPHKQLQAELDRIVKEMQEDGTLSTFSKKWFDGLDLTKTGGG